MEVNKKTYILQFCFNKGGNASQASEVVNDVYVDDTVTANNAKCWFRWSCKEWRPIWLCCVFGGIVSKFDDCSSFCN